MSKYIYKQAEPNLFTVGHYEASPVGFVPESDHSTREEAAARVNYLNGGANPSLLKRIEDLERAAVEAANPRKPVYQTPDGKFTDKPNGTTAVGAVPPATVEYIRPYGRAGEEIRKGDAVYIDPADGLLRRTPGTLPGLADRLKAAEKLAADRQAMIESLSKQLAATQMSDDDVERERLAERLLFIHEILGEMEQENCFGATAAVGDACSALYKAYASVVKMETIASFKV